MTTPSALETGTWIRQPGLAYWTFELPDRPGDSPDGQLLAHLEAAMGALEGFASIRLAEWRTERAGEDAVVERFDGGAAVARGGAGLRDIASILLELDVVCATPDGGLEAVEGAADLTIEREPDGPLTLTFDVNMDIFVAISWAENRDNGALAAVNAPRLNEFLERLRGATGSVLRAFDPSEYRGQYTETGVTLIATAK
jgi:hypothetical protein